MLQQEYITNNGINLKERTIDDLTAFRLKRTPAGAIEPNRQTQIDHILEFKAFNVEEKLLLNRIMYTVLKTDANATFKKFQEKCKLMAVS